MNSQRIDPITGSPVSRRTVLKGAAWSVPVIAAAVATPAIAASVVYKTYTVTVAGTGATMKQSSFLLPAGARNIVYEVTGGGGGGGTSIGYRGSGSRLRGTLSSPTVDTPVQLIGAGGGLYGGHNLQGSTSLRVGQGGQGFGNGGNSPLANAANPGNQHGAGGGGGGSALIIGGMAAVIAGGGGGGGNQDGSYNVVADGNGALHAAGVDTGLGVSVAGTAAPTLTGAGAPGVQVAGRVQVEGGPLLRGITVAGGGGGAPGTGGVGGTLAATAPASDFTVPPLVSPGNPGAAGSVLAGANGGAGVWRNITDVAGMGFTGTLSSGGGGGGYASGGGGAVVAAYKVSYDVLILASGGGGGANYAGNAGGIVVTNTSVDLPDNGGRILQDGRPGSVVIMFDAPEGLTFG